MIGIDLQKDYVVLVHSEPELKEINGISIQVMDEDSEVNYFKAVKNKLSPLIKDMKLKKEYCIVGVEGDYGIVRKVIVPKEIDNVVEHIKWDISQHIISDIDNYMMDFFKINEDNANNSVYLCAAYLTDRVKNITDTLMSLKIKPYIIDFDIFAIINCFEMNYPELTDHPVIIVYAENKRIKLLLTKNGTIIDYLYYSINEDESYIISEGIEIFKKYNKNFISGNNVEIFYTGSHFYDKPNIDGMKLIDPFRNITCGSMIDMKSLENYKPLLCTAVGLAMRDE